MNELSKMERSLAGISSGVLLGFLTEALCFWDGPPADGIRLPWKGALLGSVLLGGVAFFFGGRVFPDWFKWPALGFLTGVTAGVLGGALVFAPILTTVNFGNDPVFREKHLAAYQILGVIFGAALGGLVGLFAGIALLLRKRRRGT